MSSSGSLLKLLFTRPGDFRALLQFKFFHESKRDLSAIHEHPTSGWDRRSMRRCWEFLDMTSRSFSAVIKELDGDLARVICIFYLVLRGLDTVEDDMTIPDEVKQPILRSFHKHTVTPGWKFDGCGPDEKDRQLLVEYDVVVEELNRLQPEYRNVIVEICEKMENGMADFAHKAVTSGEIYLDKIEDWDLYCHYVAGLVGEGLSRLLAASGKEQPWLADQLELSNSMGLFLQKTNIVRDYREDTEQRRYFWPKEIWTREEYRVDGHPAFKEMEEMYAPENGKQALWVLSGLVVDVLRHAPDCLDYLRVLKNQSAFNFCAIPQVMAIATLNEVFMNPQTFQRNVKIRKAEAARLIMGATNPRDVGYLFRDYARRIHAKCNPKDPSFLKISISCGHIEMWCELNYPSFVSPPSQPGQGPVIDPNDRRSMVIALDEERDKELLELQLLAKATGGKVKDVVRPRVKTIPKETHWDLIMFMVFSMVAVLGLGLGISWFVINKLSPGS